MSVISIDAKKLVSCPQYPEESWRKTDPEIFFLPEKDILNFQGKSIFEKSSSEVPGYSFFQPWKINLRDASEFSTQQSEFLRDVFGEETKEILSTEKQRIVFVEIGDGYVDVHSHPHLKANLEFSSAPSETNSVAPHSEIGLALAGRLKTSCPHEIIINISTKAMETPLIIVSNHATAHFTQSYSAFKFILSSGSQADLVLVEKGAAFAYHRHSLVLEKNSKLTELWINNGQDDHTLLLERVVTVNENASFDDVQVMLPKGNTRVTSNIISAGIKTHINTAGSIIASKGKFDYEPIQEHKLPEGKSQLNLKMILTGRARCNFQGLVLIHKDAPQTVALQSNKNLLLSKNARVDASPRLEILPNEVICKHGSATGEIDAKQLYYLSSRGFSLPQARELIVQAFAFETLAHINNESTLFKLAEGALTCGLRSVLSLI